MHHTNRTTLCGILAGLLLWLPVVVMAAPVNDTFDHFTTGFPLTGGHRAVECDACHNTGSFRGTQRECASCHSALMNTGAVVKNSAHIQSSNDCEICHSTLAWDDVRRVNHMAVLGRCDSCHNNHGGGAGGPPTDSIHANVANSHRDCIECHRSSTWVSMHFNHATAGTNCGNCHSNSPGPGGIPATPPPGSHSVAPYNNHPCSDCHTTHSWTFKHSTATGTCSDCHTKPGDHLTTALECNACHSTRAWTPASFSHQDSSYPPDHGSMMSDCGTCHGGSPQTDANVDVYDRTPQIGECIDCHYNDFLKEHDASKATDPKYHNCTTDCHEHSMSHF